MTTPPEYNIVVTPVGDFNASLLKTITEGVNRCFGYGIEVGPPLHDVDFALDTFRNQYHSTPILEKLSDLAPVEAIKVLVICKVDLFIPILTHVYGEAQLGGKGCIISTYRLKEGISSMDPAETFHCRIVKEAIHELGHTFSLRHCKDNTCVMHYARTIRDVDGKSDQFCRYCKVLLEDEIKRLTG